MEIVTQVLANGNEIKYQVVNGTYYHAETTKEVVKILESLRASRNKVKFYFGDTETGRDWHEENDTSGYIGRSAGKIKIPLLIEYKGGCGGGGLLDHCIVKIVSYGNNEILYIHPNYQAPKIEIIPSDLPEYKFNTIVNGELYGRHKSLKSAEILKRKLS